MHMKVRVLEHQGVLLQAGKHLKGTLSTSVERSHARLQPRSSLG